MKTIFFVIGTASRISLILRSDLFRILKAGGFKIVIISPFINNAGFAEEFGGANVCFELMRKMPRAAFALASLRYHAMLSEHPDIKLAIKIHNRLTRGFVKPQPFFGLAKKRLRSLIIFLLPRALSRSVDFWDSLLSFCIPNNVAGYLFSKFKPDVMILASAGAAEGDMPFILAANKCGVPIVAVDNNIDAATYRYFSAPLKVGLWTLFGKPQKQELMEIHRVSEKNIAVTGALRYDYYFRYFKAASREDFFKKIKADPAKKLIMLGAKTPIVYPFNAGLINLISDEIKNGAFGPAQLFVRFDPGHDTKIYGSLLDNILWEKAEIANSPDHLANLIYHSDIALGLCVTTLAIEACILGTPAVWIGFDGLGPQKMEETTRFQYELPFAKRIISSGAIPLAETPAELISAIKKFIADKTIGKTARENMIKNEYFFTDGRAGERIAKLVYELL